MDNEKEIILGKGVDVYKGYFQVMLKWLDLKSKGVKFKSYITQKGYSKIAIYGLGEVGQLLLENFMSEGIQIEYVMDKKNFSLKYINTLSNYLNRNLVDLVIITPWPYFADIKKEIYVNDSEKIVSLIDFIYDVYFEYLINPIDLKELK